MKGKFLLLTFVSILLAVLATHCGSSESKKSELDDKHAFVEPEKIEDKQVSLDYVVNLTKKGFNIKFGVGPQLNKTKNVLKIPKGSKLEVNFKGKGKYKIRIGKKGKYSHYSKKKYIWKNADTTMFIKYKKKEYKIMAL